MNTAFEAFGRFAKEIRLKTGLTLRRFCDVFGYDNCLLSKMERGFAAPPVDNKLSELAVNLGILKGTPTWDRFFELAAACRGKLPPLGLSDKELLAKLPYGFRGKDMDEEKLMAFAQRIRET